MNLMLLRRRDAALLTGVAPLMGVQCWDHRASAAEGLKAVVEKKARVMLCVLREATSKGKQRITGARRGKGKAFWISSHLAADDHGRHEVDRSAHRQEHSLGGGRSLMDAAKGEGGFEREDVARAGRLGLVSPIPRRRLHSTSASFSANARFGPAGSQRRAARAS